MQYPGMLPAFLCAALQVGSSWFIFQCQHHFVIPKYSWLRPATWRGLAEAKIIILVLSFWWSLSDRTDQLATVGAFSGISCITCEP